MNARDPVKNINLSFMTASNLLRFGNDAGLLDSVAQMFLQDARTSIRRIGTFLQGGQVQKAQQAARSLKGLCANLEVRSLIRLLTRVDLLIEMARIKQAKVIVDEISEVLETATHSSET